MGVFANARRFLTVVSFLIAVQSLAAAWNQSLMNATSTWSGEW